MSLKAQKETLKKKINIAHGLAEACGNNPYYNELSDAFRELEEVLKKEYIVLSNYSVDLPARIKEEHSIIAGLESLCIAQDDGEIKEMIRYTVNKRREWIQKVERGLISIDEPWYKC